MTAEGLELVQRWVTEMVVLDLAFRKKCHRLGTSYQYAARWQHRCARLSLDEVNCERTFARCDELREIGVIHLSPGLVRC